LDFAVRTILDEGVAVVVLKLGDPVESLEDFGVGSGNGVL
jgi:hypothetical protein